MINFFRKIRKKMADDNKPMKYMRYAVGEIALVVIGILIALSINNWNQNRINNQKLKSYLTEIVNDLRTDSVWISNEIEFLKNRNKKTKSFLAIKDYNKLSLDSLEKSLETFYIGSEWKAGSFKKLENSGITDFGQNDTLIIGLKYYYNFFVPYNKRMLDAVNRAVEKEDYFWRYDQNLYEFTYDNELASTQSNDESKRQLIQLLQSPIPRNILKIQYRRNKEWIRDFSDLKNGFIPILIEETEKAIKD